MGAWWANDRQALPALRFWLPNLTPRTAASALTTPTRPIDRGSHLDIGPLYYHPKPTLGTIASISQVHDRSWTSWAQPHSWTEQSVKKQVVASAQATQSGLWTQPLLHPLTLGNLPSPDLHLPICYNDWNVGFDYDPVIAF